MRIRTIKPEFWRSADITGLPVFERLLFIGLWSYVDDNGVGRDELPLIVADLLAADMCRNPRDTLASVSRALATLAAKGLIDRYKVDGRPYLMVVAWDRHQRIDRPGKPRYPRVDEGVAVIRDTLARPSRDPRDTLATPSRLDQGNRGTGEQGTGEQSIFADAKCPAAPGDAVAGGEAADEAPAKRTKHRPDDPQFAAFWSAYPRRTGKDAARKAWQGAVKRATPEAIIAAATTYAATVDRWPLDERQYVPHPATWLNQGRWDDDPKEALIRVPGGLREAERAEHTDDTDEAF